MTSKNSEDIWNAVCAMNQMAVPDSVEGGQMFWTVAITPGQLHAQIPHLQKLVNELLAQMPLPVYAVFGNAVAVDLCPSAIAPTWAGFGVPPRPLGARQDAEDLRRTWHFDDARHLRMTDITVQDGRSRVYPVADWSLAANPVTVSSQWSEQCVDGVVIASEQPVAECYAATLIRIDPGFTGPVGQWPRTALDGECCEPWMALPLASRSSSWC